MYITHIENSGFCMKRAVKPSDVMNVERENVRNILIMMMTMMTRRFSDNGVRVTVLCEFHCFQERHSHINILKSVFSLDFLGFRSVER